MRPSLETATAHDARLMKRVPAMLSVAKPAAAGFISLKTDEKQLHRFAFPKATHVVSFQGARFTRSCQVATATDEEFTFVVKP